MIFYAYPQFVKLRRRYLRYITERFAFMTLKIQTRSFGAGSIDGDNNGMLLNRNWYRI